MTISKAMIMYIGITSKISRLTPACIHYCRMLLTRHYDPRPFDKTVCDAIIANGGVKNPSKKVQNVCDDGCIKHGSDFSCVCNVGHMVQFNYLFAMRRNKRKTVVLLRSESVTLTVHDVGVQVYTNL